MLPRSGAPVGDWLFRSGMARGVYCRCELNTGRRSSVTKSSPLAPASR